MGYSKILQNNKVISSINNINKSNDIELSMIDGNIKAKIIG